MTHVRLEQVAVHDDPLDVVDVVVVLQRPLRRPQTRRPSRLLLSHLLFSLLRVPLASRPLLALQLLLEPPHLLELVFAPLALGLFADGIGR